jgi:hypothetical protein
VSRHVWAALQRDVLDGLQLEQAITIHFNDGTGFVQHASRAVVRGYSEKELVAGSTIKLGDIKVMISADAYPDLPRPLETRDRIEFNGDVYAIVHFDRNSRNIQGETLMYEVVVR